MCCVLLGCSMEELEQREGKEDPIEWLNCWTQGHHLYAEEVAGGDVHTTSRRSLMEQLGTQFGREMIHPNLWVLRTLKDLPKFCIISDVRFPNEVKAIEDLGGVVIRINRPGFESDSKHPSNTALDNWNFKYVLDNDSDFIGLWAGVSIMFNQIKQNL